MTISEADYRAMLARTQRQPASDGIGVDESDLHEMIAGYCRGRGWIALHGRMDCATGRTIGEPDFVILRDGGRVLLVECKSAKGKLRPEQLALSAWAEKLGHKVHVVRSMDQFKEVE